MGGPRRKVEYELGAPVPDRGCGSCTLCCKLIGVTELEKPAGEWCKHCEVGKGCKIYAERPETCSAWHCGWRMLPFLSDVWYPASARMVINVIRKESHLVMIFCVDPGMRNSLERTALERTLASSRSLGHSPKWRGQVGTQCCAVANGREPRRTSVGIFLFPNTQRSRASNQGMVSQAQVTQGSSSYGKLGDDAQGK